MDFNKTRYRLNNIVHVEDMDNGELELIMSQLESSVFEDPFNSGDLVNLARAKIAFGQVFAFTNEQALEYFIDAVTLTDKALTYLTDDEISITESKDSFFFIKNRTQRLKNNNCSITKVF